MNVVSLLIHSRPGWNNQIENQLSNLAGTEIHACTQDTRWVVTVESDSDDTLSQTILQMQNIEGVLSAAVVYSAMDTEVSSRCGTTIKLSRRAFIKASAIASATALAGVSASFPVIASKPRYDSLGQSTLPFLWSRMQCSCRRPEWTRSRNARRSRIPGKSWA